MDYNTIRQLYYYKDGHLYYKENTSPFHKNKDKRVGCDDGKGYKVVKYNNRQYKVHRLIYCYHNELGHDDIKEYFIDHYNNIRDDNRIQNLSLVTHQDNQLNRIDTKRSGRGVRTYTDKDGRRIKTPYGNECVREQNKLRARRRRLKTSHNTKADKEHEEQQSTLYQRMNGETLHQQDKTTEDA